MALDKYKYVEEFIDPETHQPYENPDSPKMVTTPLGHTFLGHRIAKIKWVERKEKRKKEARVAESGVTVDQGEEEVTVLEAVMGEKGGWIESYDNLAQDGDCWVSGDATVHDQGYVAGDAQIKDRGDVCGHAKVQDKASVGGRACVTESAYIYGEANIGGSARIAVCGEAKVCGSVGGDAVVSGRARVLDGCSVDGEKASVTDNAVLMYDSSVTGKATVSGSARLSHSSVGGDAVVKDYAELLYAIVGDNASVSGCAFIDGGDDDHKSSISGDASIRGCAEIRWSSIGKESAVSGNALIIGSDVSKSVIVNNAIVTGRSSKPSDKRMACSKCNISANARIGGKLSGVVASGNTYVDDGEFSDVSFNGNPYVFNGVVIQDSRIQGNAHIGGELYFSYGATFYGTSLEMLRNGTYGAGLVETNEGDKQPRIISSVIDGASIYGCSVKGSYVSGYVQGGTILGDDEEGLTTVNVEVSNSSVYGMVVGANVIDSNVSGFAGKNTKLNGANLGGVAATGTGVTFSGVAGTGAIVKISSAANVQPYGILLSNVSSGKVVYMKQGEYASLYGLTCYVSRSAGAPTDQFKKLLEDQQTNKIPPPDPEKYKYPKPFVYPPPEGEAAADWKSNGYVGS